MQHIRECLHCHKKFILKNIAYEKRGGGKYCSKQCSKYATKKHSFDENFFDEINSSDKAYWLGFCMADACNTGDELTIELSSIDEDQLLSFKNKINATQSITKRERGKNGMSSLRLSSRYLCQSLSKIGCTQNKSFTLQYPECIPIKLERDFIRGFFDGDGCISVRKDGKSRIFSMYSVSLEFLMKIKDIIEQHTKIKLHHYTQDNGHIISAMKQVDIENIYHYLYDGAATFMCRKREKFLRPPTP